MENKIIETKTLLKSVPKSATIIFVAAVVLMNFLARYTILSLPYLALTAGIFVSWVSFLFMDVFTKNFGAKASNILSLLAIAVNILYTIICLVISKVFKVPSLDMYVGGQWSILLASTIAYVISALSNNYTNIFVGKKIKAHPDSKTAFAARSFISTFLSQILDNFIFVFLAFVIFPLIPGALPVRWTVLQCLGCSVICAALELLTEMIFSPIGYHISRNWKEKNVGKEYIEKYCKSGI
ncbi:MAG: VUT family protein [Clostridia bacterium]|nr:VUT family protein [Clostridia bacterium]